MRRSSLIAAAVFLFPSCTITQTANPVFGLRNLAAEICIVEKADVRAVFQDELVAAFQRRHLSSRILPAISSFSVIASGFVNLCAVVLCEPVATETPEFSADPFHIAVLGPLAGALGVFAGGDILVTTSALPIPEPSTALLFSLAGLAISRGPRAA